MEAAVRFLALSLEPAAHEHQRDDDERRLEAEVDRQTPRLRLRRPEGDEGAVAERDAGPQRDQGVHGGGAVLRRGPRLPVDVAARPELDTGRDHQDERHQPVHGVDVERQVHDAHQRQPGRQGDLPAALEVRDLDVASGIELVDRVRGSTGRRGGPGRVLAVRRRAVRGSAV